MNTEDRGGMGNLSSRAGQGEAILVRTSVRQSSCHGGILVVHLFEEGFGDFNDFPDVIQHNDK